MATHLFPDDPVDNLPNRAVSGPEPPPDAVDDSTIDDSTIRVSPAAHEPRPRRWRWQWSLMTLLLLTAAVASWTAWYRAAEEAAQLQREIGSMEALTRKLVVDDPDQYAVVKLLEEWNDENRWKVYLPPGADYRLNLATEQIDNENFPAPDEGRTLSPGEHLIELITEGRAKKNWRVIVLVDDQPSIELPKAADWQSGSGWSESGGVSKSEQAPLDRPLMLKRRKFMRSQPDGSSRSTPDPTSGILLWIESSQIKPTAK